MFKNRTIEVNLVKKSKNDEPASENSTVTLENVSTHALAFIDVTGKKLMKAVVVYIALDTARKIAVSRLGK